MQKASERSAEEARNRVRESHRHSFLLFTLFVIGFRLPIDIRMLTMLDDFEVSDYVNVVAISVDEFSGFSFRLSMRFSVKRSHQRRFFYHSLEMIPGSPLFPCLLKGIFLEWTFNHTQAEFRL